MARALIVGCGCHGRGLGAELMTRGWQVRGTSRGEEGRAQIERAGLDAAGADPDRPGTVLDHVGDVAVVVWLLGDAAGEPDSLGAIHGPRLERLLEKLVDTPVRGFVYEAVGGAGAGVLGAGMDLVEVAAKTWRIPVGMLREPRDSEGWAATSADIVEQVLLDRAAR